MKQVIYLGIKPVYVNVYQANVFQINNQRWNNNKYRCECRELIDKGRFNDRFILKPSICECKCNKSCNCTGYLDCLNWKCIKLLADYLVEECSEFIDVNKMIHNATLNDYGNKMHY